MQSKLLMIPQNTQQHLQLSTLLNIETLQLTQCYQNLNSMQPNNPLNLEIINLMLQSIVFKNGLDSGLKLLDRAKSQLQFQPTLATETILCIGALDNNCDFLTYSRYFRNIKRSYWPITNQVFDWVLDAHLDQYLRTWRSNKQSELIPEIWKSFKWTRQYQRVQQTYLNHHQLNNIIIALTLTNQSQEARIFYKKLRRKQLDLRESTKALLTLKDPRERWAKYDALLKDSKLGKRIAFLE